MAGEPDEILFQNHVDSSLRMFFVFTAIFVILKTVVMYTSVYKKGKNIKLINLLFVISFSTIFYLFNYFNTLSVTQNKLICGEKNHKIAFFTSILPFIGIYIIGVVLISIFPGWVRCFSNTFGPPLLWFTGIEDNIKQNSYSIMQRMRDTTNESSTKDTLYSLYETNPKILLNELEMDNDGELMTQPLEAMNIDVTQEIQYMIKQYILSKNSIGEGVWYLLLGIITILVSYNAILSENCNIFTIKKDEFKKYISDKFPKN